MGLIVELNCDAQISPECRTVEAGAPVERSLRDAKAEGRRTGWLIGKGQTPRAICPACAKAGATL